MRGARQSLLRQLWLKFDFLRVEGLERNVKHAGGSAKPSLDVEHLDLRVQRELDSEITYYHDDGVGSEYVGVGR